MDPLIKKALQSAEAMTDLLRELEPYVYRLSYHITGHQQDAEDLAQETLLKVTRNLVNYRGDSDIKTWVYRIALNTHRDSLRRKKPETIVEEPASISVTQGFEEQVTLKMAVQHLLKQLGDTDRKIFTLRFLQDLSLAEIASILGQKEGAIKTRLFRIRDKLKDSQHLLGGDAK